MKKKVHKDEVLKLSVHHAQDMEDALIVSGGKDFCIKVKRQAISCLLKIYFHHLGQ